MSMVPMFFQDFWNNRDFYRPFYLDDQHFGNALRIEDTRYPMAVSNMTPHSRHYYRPWRSASAVDKGSTVSIDKNKFLVHIDVQQFTPEEIVVKTTDDNCIIIEGNHDEKPDEHGFVTRHFKRRYGLPAGHKAEDVVSSLSSDGILTITAPKKQLEHSTERMVPITHTGPVKTDMNDMIEAAHK